MASQILVAYFSWAFVWCCQADLIADVCSKAVNPPLCNQTLRSDSRSFGANLQGLGQIIIEKSIAAINNFITVVKSVSNDINKGIVNDCVEICNTGIDDLNQCSRLLNELNRVSVGDLQIIGSDAFTDVQTCDDEFGDNEPAKVKEASKRAQDLIDVLLVIANKL